MRLLLIAYEFPPSPSPQSLRWTYLARELHLLGHDVHVLTADLGGETPGLPALPAGIRVHRTYPGPTRGMLAWLRKRRQRKIDAGLIAAPVAPTQGDVLLAEPIRPARNWKQRVSEGIQAVAQYVHFPDVRGEWRHWGRQRLHALLETLQPDVVISSHEPATTLELGLLAKQRGFRWVADLGDPVLASYTPTRWRRRAETVERAVCRLADLLVVTTEATAALMAARHATVPPVLVAPQGHDARRAPALRGHRLFEAHRLELLYTGSFYRFRRPDALIAAVMAVPGARLSIAAITVPEAILDAARRAPDAIRLLGFRPHDAILDLQRSADVLVNIANDDMTQIPGKVNEYLGAGRPLLNIGPPGGPVFDVIDRLQRGWSCDNTADAITGRLAALAQAKQARALDTGLDLAADAVSDVSWTAIAARLDVALQSLERREPVSSG